MAVLRNVCMILFSFVFGQHLLTVSSGDGNGTTYEYNDSSSAYETDAVYYENSTTYYDNYTNYYDNYTNNYDTYTNVYDNYTNYYDNYTDNYDNYTSYYDMYTNGYDNYTDYYDNYTDNHDTYTNYYDNYTNYYDNYTTKSYGNDTFDHTNFADYNYTTTSSFYDMTMHGLCGSLPRDPTIVIPRFVKSVEVQINASVTKWLKPRNQAYNFTIDDPGYPCTRYIKVMHSSYRYTWRRVEMQVKYNVNCQLLKDIFTKHLVLAIAKENYRNVDDICGKYCKGDRSKDPRILCNKSTLKILWPTTLKLSPSSFLSSALKRMLTYKAWMKKATMMTVIPFSEKPAVFPKSLGSNKGYVSVLLRRYCDEEGCL